jgi:hypothetical protein
MVSQEDFFLVVLLFMPKFIFAFFAPLRGSRIFIPFARRSQGFQLVLEIAIIQIIGNLCAGYAGILPK